MPSWVRLQITSISGARLGETHAEIPETSSNLTANRDRSPASFLGPGLVSAASDNDPTTVATLAVIGATTGYALCWLVVLLLPMLAVVQMIAGSIGAVTRTSLQGAIRSRYGLFWACIA